MPIHQRQDDKGQYFQYGETGTKYYYDPSNKRSKLLAFNKAKKQNAAIHAMKKLRTTYQF
jgi:hypothetical protein